MNNINSYVKDSTDFLKRIFRLNNNIPTNNNILVTIDVKSLYTNIPNEEGISASINLLKEHYASHNINLDVIHDTLELVLNNNYFEFNGQYYLQTPGTAMGTPMAPSYANIFMAALETEMLLNAPNGFIPLEWIRYIDDIFAVWPHVLESLMAFLNHINHFHPTIKFDYEYSDKSVHFLDTTIYFNDKHQLESDSTSNRRTKHYYTILHSTRTHVNEVLSTAKRYDTDGLSQMTKN